MKMRLQNPSTMTMVMTTSKSSSAESQSRCCFEMRSVQPYSTTDEYLYAMKEDLAEWLSSMYPEWSSINAENFLEYLENGVLLCQHANYLNEIARKSQTLKSNLSVPNEYCKYRIDARPGTFNARDNVSQFIKWTRRVVGVREVLMFESDDLILRKNEKNFLLCLLEIARYGSKFGVRVPEIIQLEDEIEREIQRDKQSEIMSFSELRRLHHEERQRTQSNSSIQGKCSKLLKLVRSEHRQSSKNVYNNFSISNSNGANWLRQRMSRIPRLNNSDRKKRHHSDEFNKTLVNKQEPIVSRTLVDDDLLIENFQETPASFSPLHKTVVEMTDGCSCPQRFPVVRLGEGKYRIGESGTIIFIRILRYHVMVRVGGGWDTLENYLNKHDPCRKMSVQHSTNVNNGLNEIPIVSLSNKGKFSRKFHSTTFIKSKGVKTEEFPVCRTTSHENDLSEAQLFVTRDANGRHRIDKISFKSDEDFSITKRKVRRENCSKTNDDDRTTASVSSFSTLNQTLTEKSSNLSDSTFDLSPMEKCLENRSTDDETTEMDEDSLNSFQATIDEERSVLPASPMIPSRSVSMSKVKPGGIFTAIYLAQKQKDLSSKRKCSNDFSRLERDSGFDEQDFQRERLQSNGDEDNSSFSSRRSSAAQSFSSEFQSTIYRENKAYELRLKALDSNKTSLESSQSADFRSNKKSNHFRKNSSTNFNLK